MAAMALVPARSFRKRRRLSYAAPPDRAAPALRKKFRGRKADLKGELKFHDVDLDDAVISAAGTITSSINLIAQGVTESTRVGRKCVVRQILWRYNINIIGVAGSGVTAGDVVRVILYLDKQCNGAAATVTGILESDDYQSFNNLANTSRFRILMDRTHQCNPVGFAGDGAANDSPEVQFPYTFFKKVYVPLEFDSTTGAISEIRSNNLGVLMLSKGGVLKFESKIRLRFTDGS